MFTMAFWRAAAERAIKSGGQFALLVVTAGMVGIGSDLVVDAWLLDYKTVLGAFGGGVLYSLLSSLATAAVTDGNPSAGSVEVLAVPGATADPVAAGPVEVVPDSQPRRSLEG